MIQLGFIKFLLVGIPAFLLAVPLNYYLVEILYFQKELSYFLVMVSQIIINFILSIKIVFFREGGYTVINFLVFFSIILFVRFFDWYIYLILINIFDVYFILIQIFNVCIFSYIKFALLKKFLKVS